MSFGILEKRSNKNPVLIKHKGLKTTREPKVGMAGGRIEERSQRGLTI
jgi:hypothetical protein